MYQEKKSGVNWLKFLLKIFITILVILLIVKLGSIILSKHKNKVIDDVMNNNLVKMNEVAVKYFDEEKLPKEVGNTEKVSLKDLIDDNKISNIKDQAGKQCNYEESYIQVTKLDNDYQYKSYLVCGSVTKFKNSYSSDKQKDITSKIETTKKTKNKKEKTTTTKKTKTTTTEKTTKETTESTTKKTTITTRKVTTTTTTVQTTVPSNKVEISFNTNGGSLVDTIVVDKGTKLPNVPKTTRDGATFIGWYYHGELFNFDNAINDNIVLVAKWR